MTAIHYRTADVEGLKVFYREAGRPDAPMLLLLHGFPSAGHMFRELMPQLAEQFHVVAPDLPATFAAALVTGVARFASRASSIVLPRLSA